MVENYIGKTQNISGTSIKITVVDQKGDKIIIELDDGRYFKSTIENWDRGFKCLNNLAPSYKELIGKKNKNKDGREMEIYEIRDLWKPRKRTKNKCIIPRCWIYC